jgi:hypothetical protein
MSSPPKGCHDSGNCLSNKQGSILKELCVWREIFVCHHDGDLAIFGQFIKRATRNVAFVVLAGLIGSNERQCCGGVIC